MWAKRNKLLHFVQKARKVWSIFSEECTHVHNFWLAIGNCLNIWGVILPFNMRLSPNYGRNSNIFHITNGLNFMYRKWHTGNQHMAKSAEKWLRRNLEGCRTFRNLVVSYLDRDVSYRGKHVQKCIVRRFVPSF
jgi:hypothetical protein